MKNATFRVGTAHFYSENFKRSFGVVIELHEEGESVVCIEQAVKTEKEMEQIVAKVIAELRTLAAKYQKTS